MDSIRALIATLVFVGAIFLIYSGIAATPVSWLSIGLAALGFLLAYFVWPSRRKGQRNGGDILFDILEVIIEFPIDAVIWLFRGLGRLLGGKDGGLDLDI